MLRTALIMEIYRIADARYPIWSGFGAALLGGRFNSPGQPVIYGSLTYAGAMLETLVHTNIGQIPRTHAYVVAHVPDTVSIQQAPPEGLPEGWNYPDSVSARAFGDHWLKEKHSAILLVPSVIAQQEWNVLVNPAHPDAQYITVTKPQAVIWDKRLFIVPQE